MICKHSDKKYARKEKGDNIRLVEIPKLDGESMTINAWVKKLRQNKS